MRPTSQESFKSLRRRHWTTYWIIKRTCYGYTKFKHFVLHPTWIVAQQLQNQFDRLISFWVSEHYSWNMHTPGCSLLHWMLIKHRALNFHLFLNCIDLKEKRSSTGDEHLKQTGRGGWRCKVIRQNCASFISLRIPRVPTWSFERPSNRKLEKSRLTLLRYSLMTWMKYGIEKSMMLFLQEVSSTTSGRSRS